MNTELKSTIRSRVGTYLILAAFLFAAYFLLRGSHWQGNTQLHTLMETIASLLAWLIGVMAMARFYAKKNSTFLFIGTGFLGTAMLDGYHAIVTSTFFASLFPSAPSALIPWSWIASRMFLSVLLAVSWLAWLREESRGESGVIRERSVYLLVGVFTVAVFFFFAFVPLPRAYYPELFFHRPEEFVPAAFFLLALIGYLHKGYWKINRFEYWLVLSLIVSFMSQAMFMSFSGSLFDLEFDAAHLLKKVSYVMVLTGLVINMYHLFKQEEEQRVQLLGDLEFRNETEEILERRAGQLERSNADLERSNAELGQFAYVASHDLQEPLRAIVGFTGLLTRRYQGQLDDEADRLMTRIVNATGRMQDLIGDLLTYSRVGQDANELTTVDCDALVAQEIDNLQVSIKEKGATVTHAELPRVIADPGMLAQLFRNLIGNGIKFHGEDPPRIHISVELGEDEWVFSVRDNGIGIDPEYSQRIFTIFQRLHTREEHPGTGIGLSICQKVVERLGGRIWVESKPGEGANFRFTLPGTDDLTELVPPVPVASNS
ncbi:MAG: ATP-binding protein [Dehalococcoidia bacterium]